MIYHFLDWFFLIFHAIVTLFNLFGWVWKKTRKANLILLMLTGLSWFVLGIFYGIGYCPLTDWHWQVLHKLGKYDLPYSYIKYLIWRLTSFNPDATIIEYATAICFIVALIISVALNIRDYRMLKTLSKK
ncbi:MAG TPA: DUF2784 domain-containing protein [Bacteroidales bacterium]|nr:DUF2784 domain-containing protein [Bacteroidales bacterium]HPS18252.1 DUF2784 domain-containing protein [Bacteroidales bacterium]